MESSDEGSVDGNEEHVREEVASIASPSENGGDGAQEERGSEFESDPASPPQSPLSPPQSIDSPPQSPESLPRSPASHQSPIAPPLSPGSPHSEASNQSQASIPSPASPQSPASDQSPASPTQSPVSPPQSPISAPHSPESPPQSPISAPQSPAGSDDGQQSDEEVHVSEPEDSDREEAQQSDNEEASLNEKRMEQEESDKEASSDREEQAEKEASDEESDQEENVPEINIDSGDEDNERDNMSRRDDSDRDADSDDEKDDDRKNNTVKRLSSDVEENSDSDANDDKMSVERAASPLIHKSYDNGEKEGKLSEMEDKLSSSPEKKKEAETSDVEDDAESDNDANSDSEESEVGGLIADIFGQSDDEEEFEGFNEEDIATTKAKKDKKKRSAKIMSDSEDEDGNVDVEDKDDEEGVIEDVPAPPGDIDGAVLKAASKAQAVSDDESDDDGARKMREDFVSDFDLMMQKKKEESSRKRKRRDVDIINDSDDLIADIISQMRQAADEDRMLNKLKKTATKKLKILPMVMSQLKKQDLKMAFLDQGVLNVMADWLAPLPDRSLPHLNIREGMIKQLDDFPSIDQSLLKSSGVGRALMYLFKHPKETKENRERAGKLITEWARPIFNVTTNYHSLTKEEREQRDYDHIPKKRKNRDEDAADEVVEEEEKKDINNALNADGSVVKPGAKGWIGRARVPMPSTRDYVHRPKWNVEMEFGRGPSKKPLNRIEKHMRALQDKKRQNKCQRAVTISVEGRKMAI